MTQKPEWFELSEGDQQESDFPKSAKGSKTLPITAVIASAAIIIGGAFFANANDESPAVAETVSAQSTQTNATAPSDPSAAPTANSSLGNNSDKPGIQNPSTKNGDAPAIGQLPQRGERDGDHEFGDDGDRPRFDGDHDGFRGRHHGPEGNSANPTFID